MATNSRLILANKVFSNGAVVNATAVGAHPRDEASPYLMENAMRAGRKTLWQTSAAVGSPVAFDIDLGIARSVDCAAVCGLRTDSAQSMFSCDIQWATSYYPGAWTTADSISLSGDPRDAGAVFDGGSVSKRYWRFSFLSLGTGAFSVSSIWLGSLVDLGGMHSPDAITTPFRNRLEQQQQDGSFILNDLGDKGHDFTLPFNVANASLRTTLASLSDYSGSFVYIDPDDVFYEVIARGGRVNTRRSHSTIFGLEADFARLP
jgi:hypothetical protein